MRFVGMLVGVAPLALAVSLISSTASAEVGKSETAGKPKGTIGGALLGGELVVTVEAAAGVKSGWAYAGGALLGAAGGGVGGYFIEKNASPRVDLLMLAGGMTLVIPSIVFALSRTAYEPPVDYLTDKPPADEPIANPPQPDNPAPAPVQTVPPPAPPAPATVPPPATESPTPPASPGPIGPNSNPSSALPRVRHHLAVTRLPPLELSQPGLVALTPDALALRMPAVEIQNTYTRTELAMYGVSQHTEVHIPVVSVVF
ncbi:MAG TPA: hypothetical protein VMI54_31370 [Polyangiaceae bacterium]|nr:hypothetical protein [Polyangiaceae bacterium]